MTRTWGSISRVVFVYLVIQPRFRESLARKSGSISGRDASLMKLISIYHGKND